MNWNSKKSIILTKIAIAVFATAYLFTLVFCPVIVKHYIARNTFGPYFTNGPGSYYFIATVYACALPLGIILWDLFRLVERIGWEEIFTAENIVRLRRISWMCFAVTALCLVSTLYYVLYLIVAACAAFVGLLLRVIKNVFVRAKELKEENDYTI